MINNVTLIGRLTRDAELRYTPNNIATAQFNIACNRNFKNANGEYDADFINCVMWREQAERFCNWTKKGMLVGITGRIQTRSYEGNIETFARAWLDGYEVEKEKRYLVKAKGVHFNSCLVFEKKNKKWFFSSIYETDHQRGYHTRKELEEADFGWIFDCPGIEIEEVKG